MILKTEKLHEVEVEMLRGSRMVGKTEKLHEVKRIEKSATVGPIRRKPKSISKSKNIKFDFDVLKTNKVNF